LLINGYRSATGRLVHLGMTSDWRWVIAPIAVAVIAIPAAIYVHAITVQEIAAVTGSGGSAIAIYHPGRDLGVAARPARWRR
jgi:hypothetical protein